MIAFICCSATFGSRLNVSIGNPVWPDRARRSRLRYDYFVRLGVLATLMAVSSPAFAGAGDRVETNGFVGVEDFAKDNGLGGALAPEQRPQTAPTFGARLTYLPLRTSGDMYIALGTELELSFTPSWTG